jgi:hypothetical protein
LNRPRRSIAKPQHCAYRDYKLEPIFRWKLMHYSFSYRLKMPLRFCLKLDVSGEWLDPGVLKGEELRSDGADKLNETDAVGLLRVDKVTPRRALPSLDMTQDCVARLPFV